MPLTAIRKSKASGIRADDRPTRIDAAMIAVSSAVAKTVMVLLLSWATESVYLVGSPFSALIMMR
jgi:hypothetical protein